MKTVLTLFILAFGAASTTQAQSNREIVTFAFEGTPQPGQAVFLSGSLPELGGDDVVASRRMVEVNAGRWELDVALPLNRSFSFSFLSRIGSGAPLGDPANGTTLAGPFAGMTRTEVLDPPSKELTWHGSLTNPVLHWRQDDGSFLTLSLMVNGADWVSGAFGESHVEVEFFLTGDGGTREPAALGGDPAEDPTYRTGMREIFVQGGELFAYRPAASISASRRDYDPAQPPTLTSVFLGYVKRYRVFLPRGYAEHTERYYPVVYVPTGQGLFDDDTIPAAAAIDADGAALTSLAADGTTHECITVAIDARDQLEDLALPYAGTDGLPGPFFENYANFLRFELLPRINENYRTLGGAENALLLGYDSASALTLFLAWEHPESFGRVGLLSLRNASGLFQIISLDRKKPVKVSVAQRILEELNIGTLREALLGKAGNRYALGEDWHEFAFPNHPNDGPALLRERLAPVMAALLPTRDALDTSRMRSANPFWLTFYGLTSADWPLDPDGDGFSTLQEYDFGTSPIDGEDFPRVSVDTTPAALIMRIESRRGVRYQVEESPDLRGWAPFGDPFFGDGLSLTGELVYDEGRPPAAYFRLGAGHPMDSDLDGLSDIEEGVLIGSDPESRDTDRDGFPDGDEVLFRRTDPLVPDLEAGSISGTVRLDENGDGDLAGDPALPGALVFLDLDGNRVRDGNEPQTTTDTLGNYRFAGLAPGSYYVVQEVPPGSVQTFPGGVPAQPDGLPDTLVAYNHVPFDTFTTPHGLPGFDDHGVLRPVFPAPPLQPVDPALVLEPIGQRDRAFALGVYNTTRSVSMTKDTEMIVSFDDEEIIDGPGYDLQVVSIEGVQNAGERVEVSVGASLDRLIFLNVVGESGSVGIDLSRYQITFPVRYVRLKSLNNNGSYPGFELVGFRAIRYQPRDPEIHFIELSPGAMVTGIDFGRFGRDLAPQVFLFNESAQPRVGDSFQVRVAGTDDFGTPVLSLTVDGLPANLDAEGSAMITAAVAGEIRLVATATDSANQHTTEELVVTVFNADGSIPNSPYSPAISAGDGPQIAIHSPGAGTNLIEDTALVASIGSGNWAVEYGPIASVDPYDTAADDPDYTTLETGSGAIANAVVATLPVSTLADGVYFVRVRSTDGGLTRAQGLVVGVRIGTELLFPAIEITSPDNDSAASFLTDVVGTITSNSPLREWYVEFGEAQNIDLQNLAAVPSGALTRITGGIEAVASPATLATFDPTVLRNGYYVIKVTAWNDFGLGYTTGILVNVNGEAKIGRQRLEYTDLEIELAGLPIQVRRIYDSLNSDRSGDFGFGWSLAFADPDLRDTDPDNGAAFSTNGWRQGTRIYVNAPSGRRIGFTFDVELVSTGFISRNFRPIFRPDPGVMETLAVPEGDAAFLTLQADGRVTNSFITFPYNPDRFILTTPNGTRYTYDEVDGLLDVRDRAGNTLAYTGTGVLHSSGAAVSFSRDSQGRITGITGPGGETWSYAYDGSGNLVGSTDPDGNTSTYGYLTDPAHYLESLIDPSGRMARRYEYDEEGRLAAVIDENGNRSEQTWDPSGFSGTISDFRGNVTTVRYDVRGNVVREELPDGGIVLTEFSDARHPDLPTRRTDPRGNSERLNYDVNGNPTLYSPAVGSPTSMLWDESNDLTRLSIPGSLPQNMSYDGNGNLVTRSDPAGLGTTTYAYTAGGEISAWTDTLGQQSFVSRGGRFGKIDRFANERGDASTTTYHPTGLIASIQLPLLQTSFTYTSGGMPLTEIDGLGNSIHYGYTDGQPTSATDEMGLITSRTYDTDGNPLTISRGGATITNTYDGDGNLTSLRDPMGNTTQMSYDFRGKLLTRADSAGATATHSYDLAGNRVETIDRLGRRRTFVYDARNRLTAEKWHDPSDDSIIRTISFTWGVNNRISRVDDDGVLYEPSGIGPVDTSLAVTFPGIARQLVLTSLREGNKIRTVGISGQGTYVSVERDSADSPNLIVFSGANNGPQGLVEIVRNAGRLPERISRYSTFNGAAGSLASTSELAYNHRARLSTQIHRDPVGTQLAAGGSYLHTYNPRGQVASISEDGATAVNITYTSRAELGTLSSGSTWSYDLAGNPSGATLSAGNRLEVLGDFECDWDAEGNLIQRRNTATGEVMNLTWDYRNRLTRVEVIPAAGAPSVVTYRYDYRDLPIARTESGNTVWTIYDRNEMPLFEYDGSSARPSAIYFHDPDRVDEMFGEWREGIGFRWFLTDPNGSVRTVLDHTGNVVATREYSPYGQILASMGAPGPIGFTGRMHDPTTGLINLRRRFYDPLLTRFISEDPLGFEGGDANLYRYAKNDPLNYSDPTGTTAVLEYAVIVVETLDAICNAAGIGQKLDECFTSIADALKKANAGDPSGSASKACIQNFPIPGPFPYPIPGFGSIPSLAAGSGGSGPANGGGGGAGGSSGIPTCPAP